jgi:hypothetical protein
MMRAKYHHHFLNCQIRKTYSASSYQDRINRSLPAQEAMNYMGWIQIFIHGKAGCGPEILRQMEHSDITFMPGTIEGEANIGLYWVDEKTTIRAFKEAIGSKTIFKYRLRFFSSLEMLNEFYDERPNESLSPQEEAMIRTMSQEETRYKHTA